MKRLLAVIGLACVAGFCGVRLLRAVVGAGIDGPRRGSDLVTYQLHPWQFLLMFAVYCILGIGALVLALEIARK